MPGMDCLNWTRIQCKRNPLSELGTSEYGTEPSFNIYRDNHEKAHTFFFRHTCALHLMLVLPRKFLARARAVHSSLASYTSHEATFRPLDWTCPLEKKNVRTRIASREMVNPNAHYSNTLRRSELPIRACVSQWRTESENTRPHAMLGTAVHQSWG